MMAIIACGMGVAAGALIARAFYLDEMTNLRHEREVAIASLREGRKDRGYIAEGTDPDDFRCDGCKEIMEPKVKGGEDKYRCRLYFGREIEHFPARAFGCEYRRCERGG
jgi:hypothetical protein